MDPFTLMLIVSAITTLIGVGSTTASSIVNSNNQASANAANVQMQRETNAQNQYNIEHAHQIEMADLEAAGLNPVLTAMGGSGASLTSLQAPQQKPVQLDLSGVQSAMAGMQSMMSSMMMLEVLKGRNDSYNYRTDMLSSLKGNHYRAGSNSFHSAAQVDKSMEVVKKALKNRKVSKKEQKEWDDLIESIMKA